MTTITHSVRTLVETRDDGSFLRLALRLDGAASGALGLAALVAAPALSDLLGPGSLSGGVPSVLSRKSLRASRAHGTHLAALASLDVRPAWLRSAALRCTHPEHANHITTSDSGH